MCGIAGIVHRNYENFESIVKKMCQIMAHRGPDGEGVSQLKGACLGHRRLSIIDLSDNAAQPMLDHSGQYSITFNGEIYGYQKLKKELLDAGCFFQTDSDTEVILEGFKKWGIEQLCKKLSGMYAFGIWDNLNQILYLGRDRFGEKPLYYFQNEGQFRFSSMVAALFVDWKKPKINPTGLLAYLNQSFCLPGYHIFKGLKSLPPASYLILSAKAIDIKKYWSPIWEPKEQHTPEQWLYILDRQIREIVEDELVADVGLGALLSGGVDSSLIAATAAKLNPNIDLYTVKMIGDPNLDESGIAKKVAHKIGGRHHVIEANTIELEQFFNLQHQLNEPLGDSSLIAMWLVSEIASQQVKVVLTGDGGDELFAGYNTVKMHADLVRYRQLAHHALGKGVDQVLNRLLKSIGDKSFPRKLLTFSHFITHSIKEVHIGRSFIPDKIKTILYGPKLLESVDQSSHIDILNQVWDITNASEPLDQLMAYDLSHALLGDFIPKVDTATMSHALEARTPFLHHKIAETAFQMPLNVKRLNNSSKGITKQLLVKKIGMEAAQDVIKGKRGFVLPIDKWLDNEWSELIQELPNSSLIEQGYLKKKGVNAIVEGYKKFPSTYSRIRYSLVALNIWHKQYN